jgi:hypothetical protein
MESMKMPSATSSARCVAAEKPSIRASRKTTISASTATAQPMSEKPYGPRITNRMSTRTISAAPAAMNSSPPLSLARKPGICMFDAGAA